MKSALILCGGESRFKKVFSGLPKSFIPICGMKLIERIIKQLQDFTIFLSINSADENYFKELHLPYFIEDYRYGNAGVIKQYYKEFGDDFIILPGTVLSDINMTLLWEEHSLSPTVRLITEVVLKDGQSSIFCANKKVVNHIDDTNQDFIVDVLPKLFFRGGIYNFYHAGVYFDLGDEKFWREYYKE